MTNIAFLASHNGSAARAITQACLGGTLDARPVLLVSNNPESNALVWAKEYGLNAILINAANTPDPDSRIAMLFKENKIDIVVCSGYMKLIGAKTMESVRSGILNIHPALLPRYGGKGMYGRHVHKAVFENKETETGITIHLVDDEYDHGRIVAQKKIPLGDNETIDSIEEKAKGAEAVFYIETLQKILSGDLSLA